MKALIFGIALSLSVFGTGKAVFAEGATSASAPMTTPTTQPKPIKVEAPTTDPRIQHAHDVKRGLLKKVEVKKPVQSQSTGTSGQ